MPNAYYEIQIPDISLPDFTSGIGLDTAGYVPMGNTVTGFIGTLLGQGSCSWQDQDGPLGSYVAFLWGWNPRPLIGMNFLNQSLSARWGGAVFSSKWGTNPSNFFQSTYSGWHVTYSDIWIQLYGPVSPYPGKIYTHGVSF